MGTSPQLTFLSSSFSTSSSSSPHSHTLRHPKSSPPRHCSVSPAFFTQRTGVVRTPWLSRSALQPPQPSAARAESQEKTTSMATVTTPRDSLIAEKLHGSPAASQTSSRVGSPESLPVKQNGIAVPSTENLNGNGYAAPPSEPQKLTTLAAPQPEKPSMTKRLTRMFSTKDATRSEVSINSQPSATGHSTPKPPPTPTTEQKSNPPSRKSSTTDKAITKTEKSEKPTTTPAKDKKAAGTASAHQRFVPNADVKGD